MQIMLSIYQCMLSAVLYIYKNVYVAAKYRPNNGETLNFLGHALICIEVVGYCYPHHEASTTKSVNFLYADNDETLISTHVY